MINQFFFERILGESDQPGEIARKLSVLEDLYAKNKKENARNLLSIFARRILADNFKNEIIEKDARAGAKIVLSELERLSLSEIAPPPASKPRRAL
jgi:hypothetical protein